MAIGHTDRLHTPTAQSAAWSKISDPPAPCPHVAVTPINSAAHPANGQAGLFARKQLAPNSFILPYLGKVHLNHPEDTDDTSDYDLSLDRDLGISVDASLAGNEARFINDYRGIAPAANAEFRDCWVRLPEGHERRWERRMGVFVLPAGKSGKRSAGIRPGEEIFVNYGRGFWNERAREIDSTEQSARDG